MIYTLELMADNLFTIRLAEIEIEGMVPYLRLRGRIHVGQTNPRDDESILLNVG